MPLTFASRPEDSRYAAARPTSGHIPCTTIRNAVIVARAVLPAVSAFVPTFPGSRGAGSLACGVGIRADIPQ